MNSPAVATDVKHSPASTHTPPLSMVISPLIFNSFATERVKRDQRKAELCDGQMPTGRTSANKPGLMNVYKCQPQHAADYSWRIIEGYPQRLHIHPMTERV